MKKIEDTKKIKNKPQDDKKDWIINPDDPILITGSNGFIGARVVHTLLECGFTNLRCFVRPSSNLTRLNEALNGHDGKAQIIPGNLLSSDDCRKAAAEAKVVYHLAAGIDKSFAGAFMNSVVTTRNLLDALLEAGKLKRFVNISSFAVYSNQELQRGSLLDETCPIEHPPHNRGESYAYAKIKQDELILQYAKERNLPYVILRPGAVYGPGKKAITGRVGIDTFGFYIHLGGSIALPLSYVDNCAEAIVLGGVVSGIDGEIFNVVDDALPTSSDFLRLYKKQVRPFFSISAPYPMAYLFCYLWEKYCQWSQGQFPLAFNRSRCSAEWKGNRYSNEKLKKLLGWKPSIPFAEASKRYFEYQKNGGLPA